MTSNRGAVSGERAREDMPLPIDKREDGLDVASVGESGSGRDFSSVTTDELTGSAMEMADLPCSGFP